MKRTVAVAVMAVTLFVVGPLAGLPAQTSNPGTQSLRPYAFVFIAYALVWLLVAGWLFAITRRLGRLEREVGD